MLENVLDVAVDVRLPLSGSSDGHNWAGVCGIEFDVSERL